VKIGGPDPADFEVVSEDCSNKSLPPGQSCAVTVVFKPSVQGQRKGSIDLSLQGRDTPQSVLLTGVANPPSPAKLRLDADTLRFNAEPGGESGPQIATLTNEGGTAVTINQVASKGTDGGAFTVSGCDGVTLGPGEHCAITIAFRAPRTPKPAGSYDSDLFIAAGGGGGAITARLIGTSTPPEPSLGRLTIDNPPSFANTEIGNRSVQTITVRNVGPGPVRVRNASITGGDIEDFKVDANPCSEFQRSAACGIAVSFAPRK
jgi:hypothetical protein